MNKKKGEQKHAMMRFSERAGIHFSKRTNEIFCKKIQLAQATFIKRTSNRVTVWEVEYEVKLYKCAYDKDRKQIVTVLKVRDVPPPPPAPKVKKVDLSKLVEKYGKQWKKEDLERYEKRTKIMFDKLIGSKKADI